MYVKGRADQILIIAVTTKLIFPDFSDPHLPHSRDSQTTYIAPQPPDSPSIPTGEDAIHVVVEEPGTYEGRPGLRLHERTMSGQTMKKMFQDTKVRPSSGLNSDQIVVRIEISDTGVGLRPRDVADAKLFSPYVQTEIGKKQGQSELSLRSYFERAQRPVC